MVEVSEISEKMCEWFNGARSPPRISTSIGCIHFPVRIVAPPLLQNTLPVPTSATLPPANTLPISIAATTPANTSFYTPCMPVPRSHPILYQHTMPMPLSTPYTQSHAMPVTLAPQGNNRKIKNCYNS